MTRGAKRLVPILFVAVAALTLGSVLTVYWAGLRVAAADAQLAQNREIINGLEDTLSALKDAEAGRRGFLLTGDERYTRPYVAAVNRIRVDLNRLEVWARAREVPAAAAAAVAFLTREKLDELELTIDLERGEGWEPALTDLQTNIGRQIMDALHREGATPRPQGPEAALAVVKLGLGQQVMDDLRGRITAMENRERREIDFYQLQRTQSNRLRTDLVIGMAIVDVAFFAWAFRRVSRAKAAAEQAAAELDSVAQFPAENPDPVLRVDREGRLLYANAAAEELLESEGWRRDEAVPANIREPVLAALRRSAHYEFEVVCARPQVIAFVCVGVPEKGYANLYGRDVTEARRAEERLRLQAAALEAAANGIVITDTGGTIIWVNSSFVELTGYSVQDVVGRSHRILRSGQQDEAFYRNLWETISRGEVWRGELVNRRKDGTLYSEEQTITPLRDAHGRITHFIAIKQDISARKVVEQAMAAAKRSADRAMAAAEQASRAKDHFLAVLSHELRTPLTPVVTALSMLQNKTTKDAGTRESLEMIRRNVELEARLIDDLLDMTRISRGKIELDRRPVDLSDVIRRAAEVCMADMETHGLEFGVDALDVPCIVDADPTRLQQVFWNLLRNAIKFTPCGGCVGIRCRRENDTAVVEVSDSGEGIELEALPRIFNAFEQAERSITRHFGGLGLGLAISKALVEMHGGTIEAHSPGKGQGATFCVRLPTVTSQPPVKTPPGARRPSAARALRILLVEDHGDTAAMLRWLLTAEGHAVELAGDVATALDMAAKSAFDLLVSDLGLPDRSGLELMRELRSRGHTLPGIALSGYGQEEDIRRSKEAGFISHLTKPTSPDKLVEAIASAAGGAGAQKGDGA